MATDAGRKYRVLLISELQIVITENMYHIIGDESHCRSYGLYMYITSSYTCIYLPLHNRIQKYDTPALYFFQNKHML